MAMSAPGATGMVNTGATNASTASDQGENPLRRSASAPPTAAPASAPRAAAQRPAATGSVASAAPAIAASTTAPDIRSPGASAASEQRQHAVAKLVDRVVERLADLVDGLHAGRRPGVAGDRGGPHRG